MFFQHSWENYVFNIVGTMFFQLCFFWKSGSPAGGPVWELRSAVKRIVLYSKYGAVGGLGARFGSCEALLNGLYYSKYGNGDVPAKFKCGRSVEYESRAKE